MFICAAVALQAPALDWDPIMSSVPRFNEGSWSVAAAERAPHGRAPAPGGMTWGMGRIAIPPAPEHREQLDASQRGARQLEQHWQQVARSKRHSKAQKQLLKCKGLKEKLTF